MNTEDRELDRLAAKAAGIHLHHWNENLQRWMISSVQDGDPDGSWNAREDDGDALRLAAALKFTVDFESGAVWGAGDLDETRLGHTTADDPCIRRAIVRAAAEIVRRMA